MFDIIFVILLVGIGYQLGKVITILRVHDDIVSMVLKDSSTESSDQVYKLRIETIESMLYLYDDENNFICQANTLDELAKLSQQYNNIDYAAVIHNDKVFKFVNGSVTET
jgi:hypothetical protein